MFVCCLIISHLPLRAERIRRRLGPEPLAIYEGSAWRPQLLDADPSLRARPGTALSRVLAEQPEVRLLPADPVYYQNCWDRILDRLQEMFPGVEDGGPGCAYLDIAGLESLHGGPAGLQRYLHKAVADDWRGRWGLGTGKFNARCAAVRSRAGEVSRAPSEPAALRAFLARMPAALLPLDDEAQHLLADFGLKTLGDLAAQPRGALRARLGQPGARAWDLSRGGDSEPLRPLPPAETLADQLEFPFPAVSVGAFSVGLLTREVLHQHAGRAEGDLPARGPGRRACRPDRPDQRPADLVVCLPVPHPGGRSRGRARNPAGSPLRPRARAAGPARAGQGPAGRTRPAGARAHDPGRTLVQIPQGQPPLSSRRPAPAPAGRGAAAGS